MGVDRIDRRTLLQLGGVTAVTASAGCMGVLDDGGDSSGTAGYGKYLSATDDEVFFVYADMEGLEALEDDEEDGGQSGGNISEIGEPLLSGPLGGIFLITFSAGFTLGPAGLGGLIETGEETDLESQGNELLLSNEVLIVTGDLDTDEIAERLQSVPEDEPFAVSYEETDEIGGYTLYEPANQEEGGQEMSLIAVGSEELLSSQSREQIQSAVDTINGDGRATDEFDEFQWLFDTAGDGLIAFGGYGPDGFEGPGEGDDSNQEGETDGPLDDIGNANGIVSSLSFSDSDVNAILAASFDELGEDQQSEVESSLQSDRTEVSVEFDGGRLTAEATYSEDVLDEAMGSGQQE